MYRNSLYVCSFKTKNFTPPKIIQTGCLDFIVYSLIYFSRLSRKKTAFYVTELSNFTTSAVIGELEDQRLHGRYVCVTFYSMISYTKVASFKRNAMLVGYEGQAFVTKAYWTVD